MDSPKNRSGRLKPRLGKGFRDILAPDLRRRRAMIETVRRVYESYGFLPLETPALEYVETLGKFLPEGNTPEGGIFAFRDEDAEWVALRYDLTAPLARVVAQYPELPRPFRRYQVGPVWRLEKPGPGRFREFYQFDFDVVGTASLTADAEVACVMCDVMEALGFPRGDYEIRMSSRKLLAGLLEAAGLGGLEGSAEDSAAMNALRALDKLDRVGPAGVRQLLGPGRRDPSGDFAPGVGLDPSRIDLLMSFVEVPRGGRGQVLAALRRVVGSTAAGRTGADELEEIDRLLAALGYGEDRVVFDPTIVRGMSYYTGPVFEGVLTRPIVDEDGATRQFGSVFGGGRYDGLVERFTGQSVPATGASIGVDRLLAALATLGEPPLRAATADVLVTRLDKSFEAEYMVLAQELRRAGVSTELYAGGGGIGRQMKYADKLDIPVAVIAGGDEFGAGTVTVKDLRLGRVRAAEIEARDEWLRASGAQITVPRAELVQAVQRLLAGRSDEAP